MDENAYKLGNAITDCFTFETMPYQRYLDEKQNRKYRYNRMNHIARTIVESFIAKETKCVILRTELYYNNNDCRNAISCYCRRNKIPVLPTLLNGDLYLIRKDMDDG